jgi:vesicle-associated membrane protein 4
MASHSEPYDPYIPAGGAAGNASTAAAGGNSRTAALQAVSFTMSRQIFIP